MHFRTLAAKAAKDARALAAELDLATENGPSNIRMVAVGEAYQDLRFSMRQVTSSQSGLGVQPEYDSGS